MVRLHGLFPTVVTPKVIAIQNGTPQATPFLREVVRVDPVPISTHFGHSCRSFHHPSLTLQRQYVTIKLYLSQCTGIQKHAVYTTTKKRTKDCVQFMAR
jgi:hypothetical protein